MKSSRYRCAVLGEVAEHFGLRGKVQPMEAPAPEGLEDFTGLDLCDVEPDDGEVRSLSGRVIAHLERHPQFDTRAVLEVLAAKYKTLNLPGEALARDAPPAPAPPAPRAPLNLRPYLGAMPPPWGPAERLSLLGSIAALQFVPEASAWRTLGLLSERLPPSVRGTFSAEVSNLGFIVPVSNRGVHWAFASTSVVSLKLFYLHPPTCETLLGCQRGRASVGSLPSLPLGILFFNFTVVAPLEIHIR